MPKGASKSANLGNRKNKNIPIGITAASEPPQSMTSCMKMFHRN